MTNTRKSHISRRRFLQGGAALAAGGGLGLAPAAGAMDPTAWQQTVDVLVVGAEAAGFSAALAARRLGAAVLVIEKAPFAGGTSMKSVGGIRVPNNRFLRAAGIEDRREDTLRHMAHLSSPKAYGASHPTFGAPADGLAPAATTSDRMRRDRAGRPACPAQTKLS